MIGQLTNVLIPHWFIMRRNSLHLGAIYGSMGCYRTSHSIRGHSKHCTFCAAFYSLFNMTAPNVFMCCEVERLMTNYHVINDFSIEAYNFDLQRGA